MFLSQVANVWALVWYTYLEDGTPTWYYAGGNAPAANEGTWRVPLTRYTWNGTPVFSTVGEVILTFDTATGKVKHVYSYRFDKPSTFSKGTRGRDLKISAVVPVDQTHVIVQERTEDEARFRQVPLNPKNSYLTESDKRTVANLAGVDRVPGKLEGAAFKDRNTLVVSSDDDFGFVSKAYSSGQDVKLNGTKTRLVEVTLK